MQITNDNYYTQEAHQHYMSYSQFKDFYSCEARALAKLNGWEEPKSPQALLQGSYVDAYFSDELDKFKEEHPEAYKKNGEPYAYIADMDALIARAERDELFMEYLKGDKQTVVTGTIAGVPFKGKFDILHENRIVDLKTVRDFSMAWNPDLGIKQHFIERWGYDIQAAIYQELWRQKTGETLPYYIAAITKEANPDIALLEIPQEVIDMKLSEVEHWAPKFQEIKEGTRPSLRCEFCTYCKETRILTQPIDYRFHKGEE